MEVVPIGWKGITLLLSSFSDDTTEWIENHRTFIEKVLNEIDGPAQFDIGKCIL